MGLGFVRRFGSRMTTDRGLQSVARARVHNKNKPEGRQVYIYDIGLNIPQRHRYLYMNVMRGIQATNLLPGKNLAPSIAYKNKIYAPRTAFS